MNFIKFLFIFALGVSNYGFCQIEDHFKKAEGKSTAHCIPNIDFIYMINLDQRPEKWEFCNRQLAPYGIFPYRFSAVNGWELSLEAINDVGLKFAPGMVGGYLGTSYSLDGNFEATHDRIKNYGQVYFCYPMSRGTIGIVLSHLSILQDALDSHYETIWVMEDDIEVLSDPREISHLINKLDHLVGKDNWDVLFTDRNSRDPDGNEIPALGMAQRPNFNPQRKDQYYVKKKIGKDFIQTGARFGAYSMILRKSGINKILNFIKTRLIFHPYDMDFYLAPGIKFYTVQRNIVSNFPKAVTDNAKPNYLYADR